MGKCFVKHRTDGDLNGIKAIIQSLGEGKGLIIKRQGEHLLIEHIP